MREPLADATPTERAPPWLRLFGPVLSSCALGVLGFAYSAVLLSVVGVDGEERDLALFIFCALLLPLLCAVVQLFLVRPDFSERAAGPVETFNCWAAVALLLALATLPLLIYVAGKPGDFWLRNVKFIVVTIAALHGAGLFVASGWPAAPKRPLSFPAPLRSRAVQAFVLAISLFVASFLLFWIDPSNRYLNLFIRLFFMPPFSESPAPFGLGPALLLAVLLVAAVAALGWLESKLLHGDSIGLWVLTFTSLSLLRQNYSTIVRSCENPGRCASAPYSLLLHECRDHGRCSPADIARGLNEMVHKRAVVDWVGNPETDFAFDARGAVRDAVSIMETWAGKESTVVVLIGNILGDMAGDEMASDIALMYAGKWHRWPRSSTMSDRIRYGPALTMDVPIKLREGELVLVRQSRASMGPMEAGIRERIKATVTLCLLPHSSKEVIPYRVAGPAGCHPG